MKVFSTSEKANAADPFRVTPDLAVAIAAVAFFITLLCII
jgi:hypothetical protein